MAASLGWVHLVVSKELMKRSCSACIYQLSTTDRAIHTSPPHAAQKTAHVINYHRTKIEIARTLRPKQNFLLSGVVDKHRSSPLQQGTETVAVDTERSAPRDYRFIMPEFLPNADYKYRDRVFEKLERRDMLKRRAVIDIPEFYVGSIMAVAVSDPHAPGKRNRFVGICLDRGGHGLRAYFVLRNVVDGLGVEVMYKMYNPTVLSIQVLRLEKRLDDQLFYLRNCPLEYSTFDFNMDQVILPRGSLVPINPIKVPLNPKPWEYRWERFNLKGIEPITLTPKMIKGIEKSAEPWRENDLMMMYRSNVNEEEEGEIMSEVYQEKQRIDSHKKTSKAALRKTDKTR